MPGIYFGTMKKWSLSTKKFKSKELHHEARNVYGVNEFYKMTLNILLQ
jgi:hypothetical protein